MTPILKIDGLRKNYRQGQVIIPVIQDLSLSIYPGQTAAILGPSGSGKSTLLSLLSGLDKADAGSILIDGKDIVQMDENQLSRYRGTNLGIIFQQYHLMRHLTALENVALPLQINNIDHPHDKAREILNAVGLSQRINHLPSQLSGGECQRVAIARAFITKPKILVADEPSGSLDEATGNSVMDILFDQVKKHQMTMVLVTHNRELAAKCDQVLSISEGRLLSQSSRGDS